jgi:hypothetical protein
MSDHRWSGWPGAWCLDCGIEDPHEIALADGNYIEVEDTTSPLGFHFEFPNVKIEPCPCPGSNNHNPYNRPPLGSLPGDKFDDKGKDEGDDEIDF